MCGPHKGEQASFFWAAPIYIAPIRANVQVQISWGGSPPPGSIVLEESLDFSSVMPIFTKSPLDHTQFMGSRNWTEV